MIVLKELNPHGYKTTTEQDTNLAILLECINKVRKAYGKPMYVTSGLRSQADQARINPSAPKSKHLTGQAVDISDSVGELYHFLKSNPKVLEDAKLWCEEGTDGWVHFQCTPPKSARRWFLP